MKIQKIVLIFSFILSQNLWIPTTFAKINLSTENTVKQATETGLHYQIIKNSHGQKPTIYDEVEIRFTSYNVKGEILEGTLNGVPVILPISEMFSGLQESLLLMPVGAIYEFDIPAHLGYSEEGKKAKQAVKYHIELLAIHSSHKVP